MLQSWLSAVGIVGLEGTETERKFVKLLVDENVQLLTSFQLNQIASLTYGGEVCDQVVEILDKMMADPLSHSPLCLQKSLVISKHCLIHGSDDFVQNFWPLGRHVTALQEFNTVLLAQQRGTPDAWWQRVKGGGVDKGLPVREAANEVIRLLQSKEQLQLLRHTKADPNSLVPVGDSKAAFVSDEVRHMVLQKRIDEELGRRTKSNLAKADGGFGGGYQAKDGKSIVGAAHGVEEMLAAAKREKKKFTDDGLPSGYNPPGQSGVTYDVAPPITSADLLDISAPSQAAPVEVDLMGFSSPTNGDILNKPSVPSVDPFAPASVETDLLGMPTSPIPTPSAPAPLSDDLLGITQSSAPISSLGDANDMLNSLKLNPLDEENTKKETIVTNGSVMNGPPPLSHGLSNTMAAKKPIMGSNTSRFAALDDLAQTSNSKSTPCGSADEAMQRILSGGGSETQPAAGAIGGASRDGTGMPPPSSLPFSSLGGAAVGLSTVSIGSSSVDMATGIMASQPPPAPLVVPETSIRIGASYGPPLTDEDARDEEGFGFVMGGMSGSGLQPTAPPPPMPPPPPPS